MKWLAPQPLAASPEISEAYGNGILLAEQLAKRGLMSPADAEAYLDPQHYTPCSPFVFEYMQKAVGRLQSAISKNESIGIWGDFDLDGQSSTAVLLAGLRRLGADVRFHIPNRTRESHGIRTKFLQEFMRPGLDLLITCDTGISELEALQFSAAQGLDVILTDHHTLGEQLPPALAVINPRLLPSEHPMAHLAGVGTAYQLIRALFESRGMADAAREYLDLVTLGTIADLVELVGENRYYVQMGLLQMRTSLRPALVALLDCAGYRGSAIDESLIGFTLAPRLNAVGRLDDANRNVNFLLSEDKDFLQKTAAWLEDLNSQRKLAVEGVYQSAREMLAKEPSLSQFPVLVLAKPGWEKGVVGIAASRLVEDFNKPVVLLNVEDNLAAGSVRSVEGVDIIAAIRANAAYLSSFGGHPMAAGVALDAGQVHAFRSALSRTVQSAARGVPREKQLQVDAYLPLSNLNFTLADEINRLAPFGSANPPPVLVTRGLEIEERIPLGKSDSHLKLIVRDDAGETREVLWWNARESSLPQGRLDLAYYLRSGEYKGISKVTLEYLDARETEIERIEVSLPLYTADIQDCRLQSRATRVAAELAGRPGVCLWGEGFSVKPDFLTSTRCQIKKCETLAILTPPPSLAVLQEVLKQASPKRILLFRLDTPDDHLDGFLAKISGLVKYTLNRYEGKARLTDLAAALGQTESLVKLGLQWWQAHGDIAFESIDDEMLVLRRNIDALPAERKQLAELAVKIHLELAEASAFRSFYLRADPAYLLRKV
jgi:single-stranded-DNA-specific exonuclease